MCGLPVAIHEFVVYQDPTGCLTVFYFSPFEVRDDSNPSRDGLSHLNRIKLGGAATTSVVDWATLDCLREDQETSEEPKNWQVPEVDLRSKRHPAKSASEKPRRESEEADEYQRPNSGVKRRYLIIRFTAWRWEVRGDA